MLHGSAVRGWAHRSKIPCGVQWWSRIVESDPRNESHHVGAAGLAGGLVRARRFGLLAGMVRHAVVRRGRHQQLEDGAGRRPGATALGLSQAAGAACARCDRLAQDRHRTRHDPRSSSTWTLRSSSLRLGRGSRPSAPGWPRSALARAGSSPSRIGRPSARRRSCPAGKRARRRTSKRSPGSASGSTAGTSARPSVTAPSTTATGCDAPGGWKVMRVRDACGRMATPIRTYSRASRAARRRVSEGSSPKQSL